MAGVILGPLTRPFRLIGLILLVVIVGGAIWAWRAAHRSTLATEAMAIADFRASAAGSARTRGTPRPGVYMYAVTGREQASAGPIDVDRALPALAPMIVRSTADGYETELRVSEEHIEGFTYRVDDEGAHTTNSRTKLTFLRIGRDDRRTLRPPPLHMPRAPKVGAGWTDRSTAGTLKVVSRSRVAREEVVVVGEERVRTVVVQITSDTSGAHPGRRVEWVWWSRELSLAVRHDVDMEIRGVVGLDYEASFRLLAVDPRT